ncbi:MAG: SdpI family protein [bacterium]|nr:SdpI family protein [bacterium]
MFTKKEILPIALIIFAFGFGLLIYPKLPEQIPSHWNVEGEIDNWSAKNFAVFFFPALTFLVYLLMTFIPLVDPYKKNYLKFSRPYFWFRFLFVAFLTSLYLYTLSAAFGNQIKINYFIIPALAGFFILLGLFMPKIKRNYFVGIRTPWTIHSEETWNETHKFAGRVFIIAGIASLIGLFLPEYSFLIFIIAIMSAVIMSITYSYFVFRRMGGFKK